MGKLLSVCIPTYNRINELTEVIDSLLTLPGNNFDIVITDNLSTDETCEKLLAYSDARVKYIRNEKALPPFLNMIRSIFNATGEYALYCNDRDLLYPEGISKLMEVLKGQELAFLWSPAAGKKSTNKLSVYSAGYDSLMAHASIHHPTGMVYNRRIMAEHLEESNYERFLPYINTYDFLMLDLFQYGKSAVYDGGYWSSRPASFIKKHKSGTRLYFSPEVREEMFHGIMDHVFLDNEYHISLEQKKNLVKKINRNFATLFCKYKACMADVNETAHYGLEPRFISTEKILQIYKGFFSRSLLYLNDRGYEPALIDAMKQDRASLLTHVVSKCLKIDLITIVSKIRQR